MVPFAEFPVEEAILAPSGIWVGCFTVSADDLRSRVQAKRDEAVIWELQLGAHVQEFETTEAGDLLGVITCRSHREEFSRKFLVVDGHSGKVLFSCDLDLGPMFSGESIVAGDGNDESQEILWKRERGILMAFCESCGAEGGGNYCPQCGQVRSFAAMEVQARPQAGPAQQLVIATDRQRHGAPALFSALCPGLGQLIKGQPIKAAAFFFGSIAGAFMMFIPGLIIWAYGIRDAYVSQEEE